MPLVFRPDPRHVLGASLVAFWLAVLAPLSIGEVNADQRSAALPALFEELQAARSASEATRIEERIWREWFDAPDTASSELLVELDAAMRTRKLPLALERADELVEAAPAFAEGWNQRATIHYLLGDNDSSVADIRETLALEPRHFGAISGLGLIFLRQGDESAALAAFEQVLAISPASENARRSVERVRRELDSEI